MFALVCTPGSEVCRYVPWERAPRLGASEVLCRTLEIGICGTDREIVASGSPLTPPGASVLVIGHECLAEVVTVGEEVRELAVGDLVTPVVRRPIDDAADPSRCDLLPWGAYEERGIVFAHGFSTPKWVDAPRNLVRVSESLRSVGVLTEPQTVAEKAVNESIVVQNARLGRRWDEESPRVGITGLGPIAFACLLSSVGRGWPTTVFGRDPNDSFRATLVRQLGGEYQTINGEVFHSRFDSPDGIFDLLLETTGSEDLLTRASGPLAACGAAVWLAASRAPSRSMTNLAQMMRHGVIRNHVHLGSVNASSRDFKDALNRLEQFWERDAASLQSLITKRVRPKESLEDFVRREPQGIKVVIDYDP